MSVQEMIEDMTRRIVSRFAPERVILFGSHGRDDAGADSDVDLLVVIDVEGSKRKKTSSWRGFSSRNGRRTG